MRKLEALRPLYESIFPPFQRELVRVLSGCSSILDVGCGSGSPVAAMRGKAHLIGIDAHEGSVETARNKGTHDEYHIGDVMKLRDVFKPRSVECLVALDLIEHLEKKDGLQLLDAMEQIASRRIVVFTPNGFVPQGERDQNPWQVHKSGWEVGEMRARGYEVIGINGWRPLRGEYAYVRGKPEAFWIILSDISQFFVRNWPEKAYHLLCVKSLKEP
jgi:SAM-dependent methyltransferase